MKEIFSYRTMRKFLCQNFIKRPLLTIIIDLYLNHYDVNISIFKFIVLNTFIRSFSEFKNNKFVLPTYIIVVLIQWYLNQNGMTFYGRWIILLLNLCYIMFMYKGKISKKLIYFIFVYFIFAISELVLVLLLEIFNVVSAPIDVHSSTYLIVILTTQIISVYNRIYIIKVLS